MRVTILDLDWYNKQSFLPNIKCMKLSSYHQQMGDIVFLAQEKMDLQYQRDLLYVVRESMMGGIPPEVNVRDSKVKLIGKAFRFYDNYVEDITPVQAACRPDYLLYPIKEENKMSKADMVQFYSGDQRLSKIQNFENTYRKAHYTYIVDKDFWLKKTEDIQACVNLIRTSKNVAFKEQISLKNLLDRPEVKKIFLSLNYDTQLQLPIVNDCGADRNAEVLQFLIDFAKKYPTAKRLPVYFETVSEPHGTDTEKALQDFEKCLKLMCQAKEAQVYIYFRGPDRNLSPFWFYFEEMESWSKYNMRSSFIEHMLQTASYLHKMSVDNIIYNPLKWSTAQSEMLRDLMHLHPELIQKYGYQRWGTEKFRNTHFDKLLKNEE